jgi:hypothetical protein
MAARSSPPTIHNLRLDAPARIEDEAFVGAVAAIVCSEELLCATGCWSDWFWLLATVEAFAFSDAAGCCSV